ncbi:uncharacterized protein LOC144169442 isoform X2 [Haemaphysalis longicornis]
MATAIGRRCSRGVRGCAHISGPSDTGRLRPPRSETAAFATEHFRASGRRVVQVSTPWLQLLPASSQLASTLHQGNGPLVALFSSSGSGKQYWWEARIDGTGPVKLLGFLFRWSIGNTSFPTTPDSRLLWADLDAEKRTGGGGVVLLSVAAWPGYQVSGRGRRHSPLLRAFRNVTLLRCAQVRRFVASPTAFGNSTSFSASVSGTPPLFIRVTYHDGVHKQWTTSRHSWTFRFSRLYSRTGSFHVALSCWNHAATVSRYAVAVVEEPVSALSLTLLKPASLPVPLTEVVELEAKVLTGSGLSFRWNLGDDNRTTDGVDDGEPDSVETWGKTSIARHSFHAPGTYDVSVSVSNGLLPQGDGVLVARLEQPLRVVEAIENLVANVVGNRHVVLLRLCVHGDDASDRVNDSSALTAPTTVPPHRNDHDALEPQFQERPGETRPQKAAVRAGERQHSLLLRGELAAPHSSQPGDAGADRSALGRPSPLRAPDKVGHHSKVDGTSTPGSPTPHRTSHPVTGREPEGPRRDRDDVYRLPSGTRGGLSISSPEDVPRQLSEESPGRECERSDVVLFSARVSRGSDVVFAFHFGDDTSERVGPSARTAPSDGVLITHGAAASAVVAHRYKRGGWFSVSVTATNPLGSVTTLIDRPLFVGSPAEGLSLEPRRHDVALLVGRSYSFRAGLRRGTDADVAWELRSAAAASASAGHMLRARSAGFKFTHLFDSPGVYVLTAEASNLVTEEFKRPRPRAEAKIFVQEQLTEASLCVVSLDEAYGGERCAPAELTLPMHDEGVVLRASVLPATERTLRFLWHLRPYQRTQYISRDSTVVLRFQQPGTYTVGVTCQNLVSSVASGVLTLRMVQRVVNVTAIVNVGPVLVARPSQLRVVYSQGSNLTFLWHFGDGSYPATVTDGPHVWHTYHSAGEFLVNVTVFNAVSSAHFGTNVFATEYPCNKPEVSINRYTELQLDEEVYVEAAVSTSCPVSTKVKYTWSILDHTGKHAVLEHGGDLSRKNLVLPPGTLDVGVHRLVLKARMAPTPVYTTESATLKVIPPAISFSIGGGAWRAVGPSSVVTLTVKVTRSHLHKPRITWTCEGLHDAHANCFSHPVPWSLAKENTTALRFLASSLNPQMKVFLFTATLMLDNSPHLAEQVLDTSAADPRIGIFQVICASCDTEQRVKMTERVVLKATCQDCDQDTALEFQWALWHLLDRENPHQDESHCEHKSDQAESSLLYESTDEFRQPFTRDATCLQARPEDTFLPFPPFPENEDISAVMTSGSNVGLGTAYFETYGHPKCAIRKGTRYANGRPGVPLGHTESSSALRSILLSLRDGVEASSFKSSLGHTGWLVLCPGTLRPGSNYLVEATIRRRGSSRVIGTAMERVMVPKRLHGGLCTVQPYTGVTFETLFSVQCTGWTGGREPYTYSVAYSLTPMGPSMQLYRGSHSTTSFWLPAGLTSRNHSVYVNITVEDADGFRSCSSKTKVVRVMNGADVFNMWSISQPSSGLAQLIKAQNYQAAFNYLQVALGVLREHVSSKNRSDRLSHLAKREWRYAVQTLQSNDPSFLDFQTRTQIFIQTLGLLVQPPFQGVETDLKAVSQLVASFCHSIRMSSSDTSVQLGTVFQDVVTATGHLVKSAQEVNLHSWDTFYTLIRVIEENFKDYFQNSYAPRESAHFPTALLNVSVALALDELPPDFGVLEEEDAFYSDAGKLSRKSWLNSDGGQRKHYTFCLAYRFPYVPFKARALLPDHRRVDEASTFVLDPCALPLKQRPFEVRFTRLQAGRKFILKPGTIHVHSFKNWAEFSNFTLHITVRSEHKANTLRVYIGSEGEISEDVVAHSGVTARRSSGIAELFIEEKRLKERGDHALIVGRRPDRIGNWKLTFGRAELEYVISGSWQRCGQFTPDADTWDLSACFVANSTNGHLVSCRCRGGPPIVSMVSGALELDFAEKAFPKCANWFAVSFLALVALVYAMLVYSLGEGDCVDAASLSPRKPSHVFALETARSNMQQLYLIVMHTGHCFNAGTSAAVSFMLHGEMGSSEVVAISSCGSDVLHRGSKNAFLIGTSVALGNLTSIEVWHDNSGKSPSWFLEDVVVTDCRTQSVTRFEFNSWFSVTCKDGQTNREAFVSSEDPSAFKALCESLAFALHDHHLWNSIAMMNKCSFLSRCQRLTLCLSTVLLSSALSALRVFLMDVEPATNGAFPDGLSVQRVTEAAIVCAIVHFVHHIPATVWRYFECATLPQKVWAASKPLLMPLLSAVSVWNKQASDASSYSSARYSLQSSRMSVDSESDASTYDAKDEPPESSDSESLPSSPGDKDEEVPASSEVRRVTGYQDDDVQEPRSDEMEVVAARGPSSLLEGALANLADFQRRVRGKESTATGNPSETVERSPSPSLGDSDLTCLDFDTDEDDVGEDDSSFGLVGNRSGGHPSGTAYKVPSLPMGAPNWATWVMGSVGWLVLAGLIIGSGFILVGRTQMFLAAANALCFQMTTLAVLLSVFVAYPLQALVVSVFVTVRSRRSQESPQSAFPALPCACNVVLQQLIKRVSRRLATLPTQRGQWRSPARRLICDCTAGSRPNGSSGKRVLRGQRRRVSARDRTAVGGNRLCHRARCLSAPKLVAFRRQCLVVVAALKPTSYCISSLVLTAVLLTHLANESMEHGYRQRQSITGFVSSLNQQMMEGECDVNKPVAHYLRPVLCAKAESEELFLQTGSVLLRHGLMCTTKQSSENEAMTKCAQGQTKFLRCPTWGTCMTSLQRYYEATHDDTTPQPALKFELYNPAVQIVSSVRVQLQCQCNRASFCASVTVYHLRGSSPTSATGFLELCLFVIICWKLRSLVWRRLKIKQLPLPFQFWDVHELSVAVCSLCYWTCGLFQRSHQREVIFSLYNEGKDLPTAIETLAASESASRCLLGASLFLAGLGVVRVLYASRHRPAFCFGVLPKSLGKQLAVLATSWLFLLASTCCLSPPKKGTRVLVRFTGATFGRLFGIHQASSDVCDQLAGNHTAIELFETSVALLGTLVMLSFAVRLLMWQRLGKKLTSPAQTHEDLASHDKAISQFSRTGVNVEQVNTKLPESEKLLLLVEELASKMEERASRLFTIPSEEEHGGQRDLCDLE